ncbi:4-diphosphocytidyl-2-C-methyl-D-erythritol kinase, chloroplastic/chromoplastic-like [Cornus florida]|uniref:4-diphosphocytidyl-2-C-methyl-D-erythritol kinase, chloroplastic/chromoplastic-like n=1 Tax=Cornus florida TaxID=4283 RepID=UPI0028A11F4C|nr:4-diphosphocytidyl-2-C-methyl-D-erythritol kinase, chloroplastic/chromoplastic-like [Cornus florida]
MIEDVTREVLEDMVYQFYLVNENPETTQGLPTFDRSELAEESTSPPGFCFPIKLDNVPTGAGLGGGSSNAATALWTANQCGGCVATEKELQEWSSEIGSDVPFFFSYEAAYCTGRGEYT